MSLDTVNPEIYRSHANDVMIHIGNLSSAGMATPNRDGDAETPQGCKVERLRSGMARGRKAAKPRGCEGCRAVRLRGCEGCHKAVRLRGML